MIDIIMLLRLTSQSDLIMQAVEFEFVQQRARSHDQHKCKKSKHPSLIERIYFGYECAALACYRPDEAT